MKRIERALDLKALVRTKIRLRVLEEVLFSVPQKALLRMNRRHYLNESSVSNSDADNHPNIDALLEY